METAAYCCEEIKINIKKNKNKKTIEKKEKPD